MTYKINKRVLAVLLTVCSMVAMPVGVASARPTDGLGSASCTGRWTLATKTQNTTKLTVYMCTNGYAFAHVSSTRKGGIGAYIQRSNPYGYQSTWNSSSYAATSPMLYLYKGSCFAAYGNSVDAAGSILKHNFCVY